MTLKDTADQIKRDINAYCTQRYANKEPRKHLGASVIGETCARKLWYQFRWAKQETFDGRMLRLFQRGHREEKFINEYLEAIGFERKPVTHKEIGNPHFGGTPDGATGILPKYFPYPLLLEFKTWNTKGFSELTKNGVKQQAPKHYAQMCTYGMAYDLQYALYIAINKNDDDIHIELVELDMQFAEDQVRKALHVIESNKPPKRISEQPAYWECRFCLFNAICHHDAMPDKNCRSCANSHADDNGTWYCSLWSDTIPDDFVPQGCDNWQKIT